MKMSGSRKSLTLTQQLDNRTRPPEGNSSRSVNAQPLCRNLEGRGEGMEGWVGLLSGLTESTRSAWQETRKRASFQVFSGQRSKSRKLGFEPSSGADRWAIVAFQGEGRRSES